MYIAIIIGFRWPYYCRWPLQFWRVSWKYFIPSQTPWMPYHSPYCYVFPFLLLRNSSFSMSPFPVWRSFPIFSNVGLFISAFPFFPQAHIFSKGLRVYHSRDLTLLYSVYLFFAYFSPSDHCLWPLTFPIMISFSPIVKPLKLYMNRQTLPTLRSISTSFYCCLIRWNLDSFNMVMCRNAA